MTSTSDMFTNGFTETEFVIAARAGLRQDIVKDLKYGGYALLAGGVVLGFGAPLLFSEAGNSPGVRSGGLMILLGVICILVPFFALALVAPQFLERCFRYLLPQTLFSSSATDAGGMFLEWAAGSNAHCAWLFCAPEFRTQWGSFDNFQLNLLQSAAPFVKEENKELFPIYTLRPSTCEESAGSANILANDDKGRGSVHLKLRQDQGKWIVTAMKWLPNNI